MAEERIRARNRAVSAGTHIQGVNSDGKATAPRLAEGARKTGPDSRDTVREILETVVFVIILVLLLKTFVAEAFVIPTGSMADTLFGHHEQVTCPQCGFKFDVNTSKEVDDQAPPEDVTGCTCPNCRFHIQLQSGPEQGVFRR